METLDGSKSFMIGIFLETEEGSINSFLAHVGILFSLDSINIFKKVYYTVLIHELDLYVILK